VKLVKRFEIANVSASVFECDWCLVHPPHLLLGNANHGCCIEWRVDISDLLGRNNRGRNLHLSNRDQFWSMSRLGSPKNESFGSWSYCKWWTEYLIALRAGAVLTERLLVRPTGLLCRNRGTGWSWLTEGLFETPIVGAFSGAFLTERRDSRSSTAIAGDRSQSRRGYP